MQQIPLSAVPWQTLHIVLDGQYCTMSLHWKQERLYLNLWVNDSPVCQGAICQNRAGIVQSPSLYFKGSLHFVDTEGDSPPHWARLNSRYFLVYLASDEDVPLGLRY